MLRGELEVLVNDEMHILKTFGFMYIHCGTKYEMRNNFKGVSMVFFLREDDNSASNGTVSSADSTPK